MATAQQAADAFDYVIVVSGAAGSAIQPNYLSHPTDRAMLLAGMKLARRLLRTPELKFCCDHESLPGDAVASDDALMDFARRYGATSYHLIGTARMGPAADPTAVVEDQLLVHGMRGLRVVDASVMPNMPSANTHAATMMITEKAADMIRGRSAPEAELRAAA